MGWVVTLAASLEALMGTKDKAGKGNKKPGAKNLKEKRLARQQKRDTTAKLDKIV